MLPKSNKNKKWKDALFSISIAILFIALMVFLIFTNIRIIQKRSQYKSRIEGLKEEIQVLEEKNKQLEQDIFQAGTEEHLEKVAKEQLGMKVKGEEVVVISREGEESSSESQTAEAKKNLWNIGSWWQWLTGDR